MMDLEGMQEEKRRFGAFFSQKRKEKGVSLKDVSHTLSIRESFLKAIEEGDLDKLLSPVHAQGFIKQYAAFLEIDLATLQRDFAPLLRAVNTPQEFEYGIGTVEKRPPQSGGIRSLNLLWIAAILLALVLLWAIAHFLDLI